MKKLLIIQTAFIGDVILSTALIENLSQLKNCKVDFLLRKGNESLLKNNPHINQVIIWDKQNSKWSSFWQVLKKIRGEKYDFVINLQRFFTMGLLTTLSSAKKTIGFDKNPFSFLFDFKVKHDVNNGKHEVDRNNEILSILQLNIINRQPRLYPSSADFDEVKEFMYQDFMTIAPASVWFTKQFPQHKWISLCDELKDQKIFLLGGKGDIALCEAIQKSSKNKKVEILAGKLNFLASAALMSKAKMNYTNDSAPLHIASAMNAPVKVVFCSTVPQFGFGPVNENGRVIETKEKLLCRPCGLHGFKTCPQKHFNCAEGINIQQLID